MDEKEITIREWFWEEIEKTNKKYVHIIMIATKPDIIKQAPLYQELKNRWELVVLIHTGQHYDYNLSEWVLNEFEMIVDINLNIFWPIHKKYSLIIYIYHTINSLRSVVNWVTPSYLFGFLC